MDSPARPGAVALGAILLATCLSACSTPTADVGACTNLSDLQGESITKIKTVSCDTSHDAEVYFKQDATGSDFPGDEELQSIGDDMCLAAFEPYVGISYQESALDVFVLPPNQESWEKADDREILCVLASDDAVEESLEGSNT